jgi:hypothetical protein
MTDLTTLLKDGDPVREDGELAPNDAQRMRRAIVAAAFEPSPSRTPWQRPLAIAAVGALLIVVATVAGHGVFLHREPIQATTTDPVALVGEGGGAGERRQLQFATPGGTRIIWIFDQDLRLNESMP